MTHHPPETETPFHPSRAHYGQGEYNDRIETTGLDLADEAFLPLNWPDSEDLLQSILSSEPTALLPVDLLPSQPIIPSTQAAKEQLESPWLTNRDYPTRSQGSRFAVQNLSQIITSEVCPSPTDLFRG